AHVYYPGANVAAHTGKWDFNASAWGSLGNSTMRTSERTDYTLSNKQLAARSEDASNDRNGGATLGAIVSINDRHSLGAEFSYLHLNTQNETEGTTDLTAESRTNTASRYIGSDITDGYEGTFNYVWKIDTLGSTFKVLGDYAHRNTGIGHRNRSLTTGEGLAAAVDSLYRDRTRS
ncbi:TonB-dependent receptor, partial [human gut metagenome]